MYESKKAKFWHISVSSQYHLPVQLFEHTVLGFRKPSLCVATSANLLSRTEQDSKTRAGEQVHARNRACPTFYLVALYHFVR